MSGIAIAASTMPGSVATFCSCSSDLSVRIAASRSASANTRAGTRMSSRAVAGISHSVSSIRTGSDIEHDVPAPAVAVTVELEVVVRDRLDEMARLARAPDDDGGHGVLADDEVARLVGDQALGLGEEDELGEPLGEQGAAVRRLGLDRQLDSRAGRGALLLEQLAQRVHGLAEDRRLAAPVELELQLGGVLDPAMTRLHALLSGCRPDGKGERYALRPAETRSAAATGSCGSSSGPRAAAIAGVAPRPPTQSPRASPASAGHPPPQTRRRSPASAASRPIAPTSGSARTAPRTISSASSWPATLAIASAGVSAPREQKRQPAARS